jgi:hypothetical protein
MQPKGSVVANRLLVPEKTTEMQKRKLTGGLGRSGNPGQAEPVARVAESTSVQVTPAESLGPSCARRPAAADTDSDWD